MGVIHGFRHLSKCVEEFGEELEGGGRRRLRAGVETRMVTCRGTLASLVDFNLHRNPPLLPFLPAKHTQAFPAKMFPAYAQSTDYLFDSRSALLSLAGSVVPTTTLKSHVKIPTA
jgi:hypothetical protein